MDFKREKVEQITLLLENRPGMLAELCAHLASREVNIRAITTHEGADATRVRMVVSDLEQAKEIVTEAGVPYTVTTCLALELPNKPGAVGSVARTLALGGINIDYLYASAGVNASTSLSIFGVSDVERALSLDWR
jgi:hypothetical protein